MTSRGQAVSFASFAAPALAYGTLALASRVASFNLPGALLTGMVVAALLAFWFAASRLTRGAALASALLAAVVFLVAVLGGFAYWASTTDLGIR